MCGWFPLLKALERSKTLPPACLFVTSRKTDALEKHTPNQRLSICVPATPPVHVFFGSPRLVFGMRRGGKGSSKTCFSASQWSHTFSPDEGSQSRCRAVVEVSAGSPCPRSTPPAIPTNLCHRIIVFKWSARWQMMCDQFYNNATCLCW